ncbi:hypothetical protein CLOP_g16421 [Closterium sp. NIES-67]|nr:hypothetical protein CLOP_g16421 [Closterium sp. NIES-67]
MPPTSSSPYGTRQMAHGHSNSWEVVTRPMASTPPTRSPTRNPRGSPQSCGKAQAVGATPQTPRQPCFTPERADSPSSASSASSASPRSPGRSSPTKIVTSNNNVSLAGAALPAAPPALSARPRPAARAVTRQSSPTAAGGAISATTATNATTFTDDASEFPPPPTPSRAPSRSGVHRRVASAGMELTTGAPRAAPSVLNAESSRVLSSNNSGNKPTRQTTPSRTPPLMSEALPSPRSSRPESVPRRVTSLDMTTSLPVPVASAPFPCHVATSPRGLQAQRRRSQGSPRTPEQFHSPPHAVDGNPAFRFLRLSETSLFEYESRMQPSAQRGRSGRGEESTAGATSVLDLDIPLASPVAWSPVRHSTEASACASATTPRGIQCPSTPAANRRNTSKRETSPSWASSDSTAKGLANKVAARGGKIPPRASSMPNLRCARAVANTKRVTFMNYVEVFEFVA